MSDARWALIEPVFSAWRARRTEPETVARVHDLLGVPSESRVLAGECHAVGELEEGAVHVVAYFPADS